MKFALPAMPLLLALATAATAFGQSPGTGRPTIAQFIGMSHSSGASCGCEVRCCPTTTTQPTCCPTPICEPKCCPPPVRERKCCPQPICEPKCCPAPKCEAKCCPTVSCQCSSSSCRKCCKREYPLEALLSRMDKALSSKKKCCKPGCDPCGFDLWPCVGQCCEAGAAHGQTPATMMLDPEVLQPQPEDHMDPFRDDPEQPPRPPIESTRTGVRGARLQPAIQRIAR